MKAPTVPCKADGLHGRCVALLPTAGESKAQIPREEVKACRNPDFLDPKLPKVLNSGMSDYGLGSIPELRTFGSSGYPKGA